MTRTDRLPTGLLKYFVISLALRHLVTSFYFSQYNGLLHDFNVITSVKSVCACMRVCVCSLRLRKLVSIGWHGDGCSAYGWMVQGVGKLDGFPAAQRLRFRVFLDTRKLRTCLGNFVGCSATRFIMVNFTIQTLKAYELIVLNYKRSLANFFVIKPTRCTNFTNLFWHETLHVSDSSPVHHQEFIHSTLSNGPCHICL